MMVKSEAQLIGGCRQTITKDRRQLGCRNRFWRTRNASY